MRYNVWLLLSLRRCSAAERLGSGFDSAQSAAPDFKLRCISLLAPTGPKSPRRAPCRAHSESTTSYALHSSPPIDLVQHRSIVAVVQLSFFLDVAEVSGSSLSLRVAEAIGTTTTAGSVNTRKFNDDSHFSTALYKLGIDANAVSI